MVMYIHLYFYRANWVKFTKSQVIGMQLSLNTELLNVMTQLSPEINVRTQLSPNTELTSRHIYIYGSFACRLKVKQSSVEEDKG